MFRHDIYDKCYDFLSLNYLSVTIIPSPPFFRNSYPPFSSVLSVRSMMFGIQRRSVSHIFIPNHTSRSSISTSFPSFSRVVARFFAFSRWSPCTTMRVLYGAIFSGQRSHFSVAYISATTPMRRETPIP